MWMCASFFLLILIKLLFLVSTLSCSSVISSLHSYNCTEYQQPFNSLIKRRKRRGVIFSSGSTILVTHAITKAMTGATPKGLSVSYELDIYFPLPDTLKRLYPERIINKLKTESSNSFENYRSDQDYPPAHSNRNLRTYHFHRQRKDILKRLSSAELM